MILPKKHHNTRLIVADVHNRCQLKNWDKESKVSDRRRAQPVAQIMAPLLETRLGTTMAAFAVDYSEPFTTKKTRRVSAKRYLCLFACSATRAVHLEMAYSLSTAEFLNATLAEWLPLEKDLRKLRVTMEQTLWRRRGSSENLHNQLTVRGSRMVLLIRRSSGTGTLHLVRSWLV